MRPPNEAVVTVRLEGHEQVERKLNRLIELTKELKSLGVSIGPDKEMPSRCGECAFYAEGPYRCHSEVGYQAICRKGYMAGHDMRDQSYTDKLFEGCRLRIDG